MLNKELLAFNKELLAPYSSLRHFRFMLEGRDFPIFTKHKPLTLALFRVSPPWSALQQRHLSYLAEFTSSVVNFPGVDNVVADTLLRPSPEPVSTPSASSLMSPNLPNLPLSL